MADADAYYDGLDWNLPELQDFQPCPRKVRATLKSSFWSHGYAIHDCDGRRYWLCKTCVPLRLVKVQDSTSSVGKHLKTHRAPPPSITLPSLLADVPNLPPGVSDTFAHARLVPLSDSPDLMKEMILNVDFTTILPPWSDIAADLIRAQKRNEKHTIVHNHTREVGESDQIRTSHIITHCLDYQHTPPPYYATNVPVQRSLKYIKQYESRCQDAIIQRYSKTVQPRPITKANATPLGTFVDLHHDSLPSIETLIGGKKLWIFFNDDQDTLDALGKANRDHFEGDPVSNFAHFLKYYRGQGYYWLQQHGDTAIIPAYIPHMTIALQGCLLLGFTFPGCGPTFVRRQLSALPLDLTEADPLEFSEILEDRRVSLETLLTTSTELQQQILPSFMALLPVLKDLGAQQPWCLLLQDHILQHWSYGLECPLCPYDRTAIYKPGCRSPSAEHLAQHFELA